MENKVNQEDIINLFKSDDFSSLYSARDNSLISTITTSDSLLIIFQILTTTDDIKLFSTICNAFICRDSPLLSSIINNLEIFPDLLKLLDSNKINSYFIGSLYQILFFSGLNKSPDFLTFISNSLCYYPFFIVHIIEDSFYFGLSDFIESEGSIGHEAFGFLLALDPSFEKTLSQEFHKPGIIACSSLHDSLTSNHRIRILNILTKPFNLDNDCDKNDKITSSDFILFKEVLQYKIPSLFSCAESNEEKYSIFSLALNLCPFPELIDGALCILKDEVYSLPIHKKAIQYLTKFYNSNYLEPIVNIIYKSLNVPDDSVPSPMIIQAATQLSREYSKRVDNPLFYGKLIQLAISNAWNNTQNINIRTAVIDITISSALSEDILSWNGFSDFIFQVVNPFMELSGHYNDKFKKSNLYFSTNSGSSTPNSQNLSKSPFKKRSSPVIKSYKISMNNADLEDLDLLKQHSERIPMRNVDQRSFHTVNFDGDSSDSELSVYENKKRVKSVFDKVNPSDPIPKHHNFQPSRYYQAIPELDDVEQKNNEQSQDFLSSNTKEKKIIHDLSRVPDLYIDPNSSDCSII